MSNEKLDDILGKVKTIIEKPDPEQDLAQNLHAYEFKVDPKRCVKCSYQGKTIVPPNGNFETARVMFVGDAPGYRAEDTGIPFMGTPGQMLRALVKKCGFKEEEIYYTNVCKCRPPAGASPGDKEVLQCKKNLMNEIAEFKGELVVVLGNIPLKAVLGKGMITAHRGYGHQVDDHHVFCMYNPAYVLRNKGTVVEDAFLEDLLKVYKHIHQPCEFKKGKHYEVVNSQEELELMITELDSMVQTLLAFDIETTGFDMLDADIKVVSMSFSTGDRTWVIPMNHPKSPWLGKEQWVVDQCEILFKSKKFKHTGQNAKFDIKFMMAKYGMQIENLWCDTMILHFILTGKYVPHGLKAMAWRYTDCGGYGLDRADIMQHDYEEILQYNAHDSEMTIKVLKALWQKTNEEQQQLMTEVIAPAEQVIAEMELNGVKLDMDYLGKVTDEYVGKVTELEDRMHTYPIIKQIEEASEKVINFQSPKQLRRVLELMGIDTKKQTKKTKQMSTDGEALKKVKSRHKFIKDLLQHRKDVKVLGTYLKPYVEKQKNGFIHADYSFINTATGRLASFNPNFQNIPYNTRPVFVSRNGYFFFFFYSQ